MAGPTTDDSLAFLVFLLFLLWGVLTVVYPYEFAKFQQQLRAIGSTRLLEDVEPENWYVQLERALGVFLILISVAGLVLLR